MSETGKNDDRRRELRVEDEALRVARAASDAALATEGVVRLGQGLYAEAATYGAGEKVVGVMVDKERVEVHVVVGYPPPRPLPELAGEVRERVAREVGGRTVNVVIDDVEEASER